MKNKNSTLFIGWRYYIILSLITLTVAGLTWRVFDLAILKRPFLTQQGDERVLRMVSAPAFRGMMVDRNGFPLAVSTAVFAVWINPQTFKPSSSALFSLSRLLGMKHNDILKLRDKNLKKKREFVYLKRAISPELANKIKTLKISGLYFQQAYQRYYPEGEAAAQLVGITNIDDRGQEGLELAYNRWLQGEPGKKWVIKDRLGRIISDVQMIREQKPGKDLVLSVDRRIQYLAYRELLTGVIANQAAAGSAIVLDAKTGEILAMANVPSFNPNHRPIKTSENFRNRAVTDIFEPGSIMKAFTEASALESGLFHPDSIINTSPGWMRVGHHVVKDERNNGLLSMAKILQISSNMGAAKIVLALPSDQLWNLLHRVGFGETTGISFPGEQDGTLEQKPPGSFELATLSFGYGLSATAMQITRGYSVFANEGIKVPISLLRVNAAPQGERVLNQHIANQILLLLEAVFAKGGTAASISIPGYRVAGKTGTAWRVGKEGYQKNRYNSLFVGIAPLSAPRLVVAVVIYDPLGKNYYGGEVSGPVFQRIMEGTLRIMDVAPDANAINS